MRDNKLKPNEYNDIERFKKEHPLGKFLTEYMTWKFAIGDVILRYRTDSDGAIVYDNVSETCQIVKKYRVVHVDSLGIPWVKQLRVRGGMGNKLYCIANMTGWSFKVDPEQLDALILGYQYDPRIEYKKMRDQNPDYGKDQ
jgi:hypothetical protein